MRKEASHFTKWLCEKWLEQYHICFSSEFQQKYFIDQQRKHEKTSEQAAATYRRKRNNNQSDFKKPSVLKVGHQFCTEMFLLLVVFNSQLYIFADTKCLYTYINT